MTNTALLIIDLQNDYFAGGAFPLWQAKQVKDQLVEVIKQATECGILPIHIQHIAESQQGLAPFFNQDTIGVNIHPDILKAAPEAPVVVKHYADSFYQTNLDDILKQHGIKKLLIAGMMTQNCVTHTAISEQAKEYDVEVLTDACTTVTEMLHLIALNALAPRVKLLESNQALLSLQSN
ncbi:isochorismatase family protein [Pseudoalteromonas sp. APAL1]|uniref:cysteine hydrolase family protein n=1 Tax=Pseudoalteromonas TaxID=53246 RepID=UPI000EEB55F3|nr:isochorismatase family protein [Pseudoalteromonas sp. APAL1]MCF2922767.1 isochorismatase family protein [Pseudoalteromonas sp. APAL1]HCV04397.1 cysteine hydrolase [Pseudoalteromonas sp.]|tara:strand:- start:45 stop:581 length:537 start_codon:yes stop_codon:yes gene_type:complete